jgi:hypothetical protein
MVPAVHARHSNPRAIPTMPRFLTTANSPIAGAAEAMAQLFISADIRHFRFADYKVALAWLKAPRESMNRAADAKAGGIVNVM